MRNNWIVVLTAFSLIGCGIKEKIEQRVAEEVAEKAIEVAAGGEIDVETRDGKVSIEGKNGEKLEVDGEAGTTRVTDADGKVIDYAQTADGTATVKGSDGLDAAFGTTIPADFPIALPAQKQVSLSNRTIEPDGRKTFMASFEAESRELEPIAKQLQTALEAKGLTVERSDLNTPDVSVVTLAATQTTGKIESSVVLSNSPDAGVQVTVTWVDTTAVAP